MSKHGNGSFDFEASMRGAGYHSDAALAKTMRVTGTTVLQWRNGKYAPNHPLLGEIARQLDVSEQALAGFAKLKPLSMPQIVRMKMLRQANGRPGTAVVLAARKGKGRKNGNGAKLVVARNKLKRGEHGLRQAARSLATTINVATMRGDRYVEALPTDALAVVMTDYFDRLGIKGAVIVSPSFAELFD